MWQPIVDLLTPIVNTNSCGDIRIGEAEVMKFKHAGSLQRHADRHGGDLMGGIWAHFLKGSINFYEVKRGCGQARIRELA